MAQGDYYFSTDFIYNIFDADEHMRVRLWREGKKNYTVVGAWTYSTFMMNTLAHRRAESRIMKLRKVYGAVPIPK